MDDTGNRPRALRRNIPVHVVGRQVQPHGEGQRRECLSDSQVGPGLPGCACHHYRSHLLFLNQRTLVNR